MDREVSPLSLVHLSKGKIAHHGMCFFIVLFIKNMNVDDIRGGLMWWMNDMGYMDIGLVEVVLLRSWVFIRKTLNFICITSYYF